MVHAVADPNSSTGECIKTLSGHENLVRSLSFDPGTMRLVSGSYDRTIRIWDVRTGKVLREFSHIHSSHIFDVAFHVSKIIRSVAQPSCEHFNAKDDPVPHTTTKLSLWISQWIWTLLYSHERNMTLFLHRKIRGYCRTIMRYI